MSQTHDEQSRQHALDSYHLVESLPDAAYDDIARLASILCDAPIALVSLIDRERQWFKARTGIDDAESRREHAICDHAIRTPGEIFEVGDLAADDRFASNPFVGGDAQARFYAGMPLVTPGGAAVGTVCVLDRRPRELDATQREALASLARLTMNLMEFRREQRQREVAAGLAPVAATAPDNALTVCVIELQNQAALFKERGERAMERLLVELDALLGSGLRVGDSANRVTGSAEFILALHGTSAERALSRIVEMAHRFGQDHGLELLTGTAHAQAPAESPTAVYLRAEAALSQAKDAIRNAHASAH